MYNKNILVTDPFTLAFKSLPSLVAVHCYNNKLQIDIIGCGAVGMQQINICVGNDLAVFTIEYHSIILAISEFVSLPHQGSVCCR